MYERVEALNGQFNQPLPVSEVKSISKSIANWTYKHFTPEGFRKSQAVKGAKGGKVSKGGGRPSNSALNKVERDKLILKKKELGLSNRAIAESLSISASTVSLVLRNLSK